MHDYYDAMTLPDALDLMKQGLLPEQPSMSAAEASEALLQQDIMALSGWKFTVEARATLLRVCEELK